MMVHNLTRVLWQVDGQSHVVHSEEEPMGTRLTIDSLTCLLANETDPSRLIAVSPGKLVRYLVAEGAHITKDQPYIEIEVRLSHQQSHTCRRRETGGTDTRGIKVQRKQEEQTQGG